MNNSEGNNQDNQDLDLRNNKNSFNDDQSDLEKLQENLYSPNFNAHARDRRELRTKEYEVQNSWGAKKDISDDSVGDAISGVDNNNVNSEQSIGVGQNSENPAFSGINLNSNLGTKIKPKNGIFIWLAIIAFIFFLGSAGYGFYAFYSGNSGVSGGDVDIQVVGPTAIGGGEELNLDIVISNNNKIQLETVDLVIEYPDGTKTVENLKEDLGRFRTGLGTVDPNTILKTSAESVLFGEEGEKKEINVKVEYRVAGSNAIFEKNKIYEIVLQSSPIRMTIDSVKEITASQELEFNVKIASNSAQDLKDVLFKIDYPFGFALEDAGIDPTYSNNYWLFEDLRPGEVIEFKVTGRLEGQNNEERVFKFNIGLADTVDQREFGALFTTLPKSITIQKPFLAFDVVFDGDSSAEISKNSEQQIQADINYVNNTDSLIKDSEIIVKINGDVIDPTSIIASDGFYRSSDNTIIWNNTTTDKLDSLAPGKSGSVSFAFQSKRLATAQKLYENPEITFDAKVTGDRISENNVPEEIEATAFKRIKINSKIDFNSLTIHDFEGDIVNSGPIPPRANQETSYEVVLTIKNTSNDLENVRITGLLPENVRWLNEYYAKNEKVTFDAKNRQLEWNAGNISEFTGYTNSSRQLRLNLAITPSISQIGNSPDIIKNLRLTATDRFTGKQSEIVIDNVTTRIETSDSFFDSRVVQ